MLKFYPKRGSMPKWPGKGPGSYPYIGRKFDAETRANKATKDPAECVDFVGGKLTDEAKRLRELCARDGDLLPADKATAAFCGVPFVELEQDADGEWVQKKAATKSQKAGE